MEVSFYRLADGGFSPQSYRRTDCEAEIQRDWPLLEDAFACIAAAVEKQLGSVAPSTLDLGPPRLDNDRVVLWATTEHPPIAVIIKCDTVREVSNMTLSDEGVRALLVAPRNRNLAVQAATLRLSLGTVEALQSPRVNVIRLEASDLRNTGLDFEPITHAAWWVR
jgi:hypothetical protein